MYVQYVLGVCMYAYLWCVSVCNSVLVFLEFCSCIHAFMFTLSWLYVLFLITMYYSIAMLVIIFLHGACVVISVES